MRERKEKIRLLDLKAQYLRIKPEIQKAIDKVMEDQSFILGESVKRLEAKVASYCNIEYALGVASGSDALLLSLMALGIEREEEVITTPYTFFSTASSITRLGAYPLFSDIMIDTYNIDPEGIKRIIEEDTIFDENRNALINKRTKRKIVGIIPVHLFGQCADMEIILEMGRLYNLKVIEDSAQALGAEYIFQKNPFPDNGPNGPFKAGAMGDTGCLSFFPSKNLGGAGDGGMVLTGDSTIAERIRRLRVHGSQEKYYHREIGINSRLDALQAALLEVKLRYLDIWNSERREKANIYYRLFAATGLEGDCLFLPKKVEKSSHIFHQFVIRAKDRNRLKNFLEERGIETAVYYPLPLHLQECFKYLGYKSGDLSLSERLAQEALALPIYPEIKEENQECVVNSIKEFYS